MSENKPRDVESRNRIIDYDGRNMLVSASAGTGKTTIMISRILSLIKRGWTWKTSWWSPLPTLPPPR